MQETPFTPKLVNGVLDELSVYFSYAVPEDLPILAARY